MIMGFISKIVNSDRDKNLESGRTGLRCKMEPKALSPLWLFLNMVAFRATYEIVSVGTISIQWWLIEPQALYMDCSLIFFLTLALGKIRSFPSLRGCHNNPGSPYRPDLEVMSSGVLEEHCLRAKTWSTRGLNLYVADIYRAGDLLS